MKFSKLKVMASPSRTGALPSDSHSQEPRPALERSVPPRPPVTDAQAMLERHIKRKESILRYLKVREQMSGFPGCYTKLAPSEPTDQEQRRHEPVHLPPVPSTKNASEQQGARPRFPIKSSPQLAPAAQTQLYKYSSTEYVLINNKAVISVCEDDIECQSLELWEKYNQIHRKALRIPFFARYKMWKPFYVWRTNIRARKIRLAKQSLRNTLFIVSPSLSSALIDIRKMCCQITETGFCHMNKTHTYTLQEFQDTKIKQLQEASMDLEKFHELVKEVTVSACGHFLLEAKARHGGEKIVLGLNVPSFFNRIIHFIRLVGYLVVTTLHSSVVNTVDEMLTLLQVQAGQTPSDAIIQSWGHDSTAAEKESADSAAPHFHPVFMCELILDTNSLTYKPSEENFQDAVVDFIERFKNMVMSVKTLSTDPVFDAVMQPEGDEVVEEYENAPPLEDILKDDGHLKSIINGIQELLRFAFAAAGVYASTFERFRLAYRENESLDLDPLQKQDRDAAFFEKALALYPSQHEEASRIQQERRLGLLLVDTRQLKETLQSSSLRCLQELAITSIIAMRTNAILILSAFMLILMIPASSSNTNQNSTNETTIMTSTQLDVTQAPTGDTQKYSTFQTSSSTFPKVLSMTTNSKAPNTSSTSPTASTSNAGKPVWLILILLVIIVVMVIVGCVHHFYNQESDQGSSVPRLLLDVRESLRTCIRNLEDQVGVRLWLGDRRGVENAMEEADASQAEEGEEWKSDGRGGNSEVSNNENGEQKEEEDSDTSDDYSSMEGDNLRERALNRQNEEDKDGDETTSSSDESQTDAEGKSGRNKNEDSEELALVKSPQEDDEKADLCDVTAL